jgi:hypothetical protein
MALTSPLHAFPVSRHRCQASSHCLPVGMCSCMLTMDIATGHARAFCSLQALRTAGRL